MQADDPPYLSVGTAVSAKYKGAFCEAKVSRVERMVKCKVTFKSGLAASTVSDNEIKGTLRVGQQVQVKHPEHKELVEATVTKIQDCSQYTVVFDDGDITTLRRTALCLKSGRHFNESETLDQLPLTHPEHFGIPVMGGRRGRRNRLLKDESSDEEMEEENEPDLEGYTPDIGRVVSVETGENKRGREKWFPGLIVIPSAQPTVKINVKDEFLIRSFRDDRYYTVPKKEVNEFNRDLAERTDSSGLSEAIQKAIKFLDHNELPLHWEKNSLFNVAGVSDSEDNVSDSSDDEQSEEKDRFVAQLYKYMDDSGTPLNKTPTVSNKDIDLHRLFLVVDKMGGYNRVTNQNKWKSVAGKMRLSINLNVSNQVKSVYKKCLLSYEGFFRTLGVTMSNPTKPTKKDRGRSLIRDKDRTPMSSPRPERDDEMVEKLMERKVTPLLEKEPPKLKRKADFKVDKDAGVAKKVKVESVSDVSDVAGPSGMRPKRHEAIKVKDKKVKTVEKVVKPIEEVVVVKKEEKVQCTRSKSSSLSSVSSGKPKETPKEMVTTRHQNKEASAAAVSSSVIVVKSLVKLVKKVKEEDVVQDKKPTAKLKKKLESSSEALVEPLQSANIGDKLIVYYGPTNESKVTYEAKVVDMDKDISGPIYLVHYTGWNTRYDEWIPASRIAENLSSGVKSKRSKIPAPVNVKPASLSSPSSSSWVNAPKTASTSSNMGGTNGKRSRLTSVSSREENKLPPRSTTPSSVTSTSSTSRSPAIRSSRLAAKQESKRRISAQTDVSVHSESDSDSSGSEAELPRTRSGSIKTEEPEVKVYKKRVSKHVLPPPPKLSRRKEPLAKDSNAESEKEDDSDKAFKERKVKKVKKPLEKSTELEDTDEEEEEEGDDDEEDRICPSTKGRDFDLNQIRSELKGFSKALKVPSVDAEKDGVLSSDDSSMATVKKEKTEEVKVEPADPKLKMPSPKVEPSSSSEDIYEFKEPEPFEFESSRTKLADEKGTKKRIPRIFDTLEDKSPRRSKTENKLTLPEPRTYSRLPKKVPVSEDEEDEEEEEEMVTEEEDEMEVKNDDPFDKLIESPSFNLIKTSPDKGVPEMKPVVLFPVTTTSSTTTTTITIDQPLTSNATFKELDAPAAETSDECSRDMELSDCESQTQIFTREDTLFSAMSMASSSNKSPSVTTADFSASKSDEAKTINSDDEDIQAQIQRAIDSTDEESSLDAPPPPPPSNPVSSPKKTEDANPSEPAAQASIIEKEAVVPLVPISKEVCPALKLPEATPLEPKAPPSPKKPIDPALQETDSTLLELIVSKPPLILNPKLDDTGKELTVKTGTRIADSILQKFNFIKNNFETKKTEAVEVKTGSKQEVVEPTDIKSRTEEVKASEETVEVAAKPSTSKVEVAGESRRRRRAISKPIVEDSESDSSDSEHLVIGSEEDEDSQTNSSDNKPLIECKNTDSNMSLQKIISTTDDSQSQAEKEKRNFSFDDILSKDKPAEKAEEPPPVKPEASSAEKQDESKTQKELEKEEQDPNLHSLLLCEEELPRSPAPVSELPGVGSREGPGASSSVHEMPFASAPGSSNSKMLLEPVKKHQAAPPLLMPIERENRVDAQAVIENTPPTTPESTISNLSPRGDNGNISPNSNDSKSNEGEPAYSRATMKVSPYSEEDTQPGGDLNSSRKVSESFGPPLGYRKRRRSLRNSEDGPSGLPQPAKRGRKPRQRRDSDSDDASENSSMAGSLGGGGNTPGSTTSLYERVTRSPRPSKYNFFVEFDPTLDSTQRIAVLQQKLSELRKTYADVKAELATVERRRKKLRRREREALKTAKQEMACA